MNEQTIQVVESDSYFKMSSLNMFWELYQTKTKLEMGGGYKLKTLITSPDKLKLELRQ